MIFRTLIEYLFGDTHEDNSKLDQIIDILKELYAIEEYKDFGLWVTGHSLGGALSQLLAFTLAGVLDAKSLPAKQVVAVTYASPRVGNKAYQAAFKVLEEEGKLRHIRVSNHGDVVAVAPSVGYYQTGVNLHVKPNGKMEIGYEKDRSMLAQIRLNSASMHSLSYYHERIFREENSEIIQMNVEEIYKVFAEQKLRGF